MKNLILTSLLLLGFTAIAQNVSIPDNVLKNKILNHSPVIDTNNDNEIQISEAETFTGALDLHGTSVTSQIVNLTGLEAFINITELDLHSHNIETFNFPELQDLEILILAFNNIANIDISQNVNLVNLDVSGNLLSSIDLNHPNLSELKLWNNNISTIDLSLTPNLVTLDLSGNAITVIDVSMLTNLGALHMWGNPITSIDVSNNPNLVTLDVVETNISELDVSNNYMLTFLNLYANENLTYVNLKNGNGENLTIGEGFLNTPNIEAVCVDNINLLDQWQLLQLQDIGASVTTYCSFAPAQSNIVQGELRFNTGDGCEAASALPLPNTLVKTINGANSFGSITNENGEYLIYTEEGLNTTYMQSELPPYFTTSPGSHISDFTGYGNTDVANFCMDSSQSINDLNVVLFSTNQARPGFPTIYKIVYENMGTTILSGEVTFQFDENMQSFVQATPTVTTSTLNTLTFGFTDLAPLQNGEIEIEMSTFGPSIVDIGDELIFNVSIAPDTNDYTLENNSVSYFQVVINSYDPNDKTILEGSEIAIENADEYLHYMIRFQNTGTASAVNIVVTDTLIEKLDWDSMRMVSASHDYRVQITNDNFVEFIFEGIELPHEDADEEGSKGYIVYKIKPKDDVVVGDIIDGDAAIYFDFNQPIITNIASTEIVEATMSTNFFNLENSVKIYPNPASEMVNISAGNGIGINNIEVYSITGKKLLQQSESSIDINRLPQGIYFVKIYSEEGTVVKKLIKE